MRGFFMCFSRLGDAGSGQVEKRRSPRASGGAAATRAKASLRAGAAAARGFRPPRGFASCSNTRARYIHVPLGRNPLAATSFATVVFAASAGIAFVLPEPASTKPRTSKWRKTRWCGDWAQAGHGWPALACWSHGWRNQAMRTIPALPRLPPKATNPGALRPHCRGSPRRRKLQCFETALPRLPPKPVDSGAFRLDVFRLPPIERRAKTNGARGRRSLSSHAGRWLRAPRRCPPRPCRCRCTWSPCRTSAGAGAGRGPGWRCGLRRSHPADGPARSRRPVD